jgi:hypothetical protein
MPGEKAVTSQSILWRRLDQPGHESCRLLVQHSHWHLSGAAVFAHDQQPCRLDYSVVCDSGWHTVSARVAADSARRWRLNEAECPAVAGSIDVDLNFSPSTNLLPIRRLGLAIGQEAKVQAAWLRFPSFALEPLEQRYRRIDDATYRYESAGGKFIAELRVNAAGFVTRYPNVWQVEAAADERSGP